MLTDIYDIKPEFTVGGIATDIYQDPADKLGKMYTTGTGWTSTSGRGCPADPAGRHEHGPHTHSTTAKSTKKSFS